MSSQEGAAGAAAQKSNIPQVLAHSPKDNVAVEAGQTFCVISSAVPGETTITAYAPEVYDWECGRTVLKIVWAPGMSIDPHDHRMWAVIGIYGGVEDSQYFRRRPPGLERVAAKTLARGEVATLGHDVIHAVKNPRSTPTAAIHVYGGDFFATPRSEWDPETQEERPSSGERSRELFLRFGGVVITEVE